MEKLQLRAILAGAFFGIYPLLLNRSNIKGNVMAAIFSFMVAVFILPFALNELRSLVVADWRMLIGASAVSAIAMMSMTSFLAASDRTSAGLLVLLMIITQATVTGIYQAFMDKGISVNKILGFAFAIAAVVFLNKK